MIEQMRSNSEDPGDEFPSWRHAICWMSTGRSSNSNRVRTPRHWRIDRHAPDQRFTGDLGVLNLLHQLRQSKSTANSSQASTLRLHELFGLNPAAAARPPGQTGSAQR